MDSSEVEGWERELAGLLAADAGQQPAFAYARRACVGWFLEQMAPDFTHAGTIRRILATCREYEALRGAHGRPSHDAERFARRNPTLLEVYERGRNLS